MKWIPCILKAGCVLLLYVDLTGCSKGEKAIEQWNFTQVTLTGITVDSFRLKVTAGDQLLTDSMPSPGTQTVPAGYYGAAQHVLVTDQYTNRLLLDTMINYKTGLHNTITFFQPYQNARLTWIGPPVNEPAPAKDNLKFAIVYGSDLLPEEVSVVWYTTASNASNVYDVKDSFLLKKGEFSRYMETPSLRKAKVNFYNAATRDSLGSVFYTYFSDANVDYSIYFIKPQGINNELFAAKIY